MAYVRLLEKNAHTHTLSRYPHATPSTTAPTPASRQPNTISIRLINILLCFLHFIIFLRASACARSILYTFIHIILNRK